MDSKQRWLRRTLIAAGLVAGLAAPAHAQDDPASRLERVLRDWMVLRIGPFVPIENQPIQATPQDGGFAVSIPLAGDYPAWHMHVDGAPLTVTARPLDGTRWAMESLRVPSPITVTTGTAAATAATTTYRFDTQSDQAVIDPSFATASTWTSTIKGYASQHVSADGGTTDVAVADFRSHTEWRPTGDGRIDFAREDRSELTVTTVRHGSTTVSIATRQGVGRLAVASIAADQVAPLQRAIMALALSAAQRATLGSGLHPPGITHGYPSNTPPLTPAERAAAERVLDAIGTVTGSVHADVSSEDVHIAGPRQAVRIGRLDSGIDLRAPGDQLEAHLHVAMDGIDTHEAGGAMMQDLRPRRIVFAPSVSGLSASRVRTFLRHVIESDGHSDVLKHDAQQLLTPGLPLHLGLDALLVDLGQANLSGTGQIDIAPDGKALHGHAHLVAEGLDVLIGAVKDPRALPLLAMMKGFGRQDGPRTVWDIDYTPAGLTVNGTVLPLLR